MIFIDILGFAIFFLIEHVLTSMIPIVFMRFDLFLAFEPLGEQTFDLASLSQLFSVERVLVMTILFRRLLKAVDPYPISLLNGFLALFNDLIGQVC